MIPRTWQWAAITGYVGLKSQAALNQTPFLTLPDSAVSGQSHFCLVPQFPFQPPFF